MRLRIEKAEIQRRGTPIGAFSNKNTDAIQKYATRSTQKGKTGVQCQAVRENTLKCTSQFKGVQKTKGIEEKGLSRNKKTQKGRGLLTGFAAREKREWTRQESCEQGGHGGGGEIHKNEIQVDDLECSNLEAKPLAGTPIFPVSGKALKSRAISDG